jgi:flagellum-specific ATP synthase
MPGSTSNDFGARCTRYLNTCRERVDSALTLRTRGRLTRVAGLVMEAVGLRLSVGSTCLITQEGVSPVEAEVVGFAGDRLFLMPVSDIVGLTPGASVQQLETPGIAMRIGAKAPPLRRPEDRSKHLPVGDGLLGRVLDGAGRPLDRLGPVQAECSKPLTSRAFNPIEREPITATLDVGVRAINALLTVGRGQRMGLFAGSGVGKSVLLGMMARYTAADIIVVGLVGERGREVKEFIEHILGTEGLARSVVVAAPADTQPLLRLQAAAYATTIAEHFRDQGKHVLLIMDSLTRYAMAQREIALAIGEPPATKGYPPSVFARLPQLVERAGNGSTASGGSITAFYTVLTEGDDQQDPIADAARAILDGHIVLTRELADAGHYPAIDIEASVSRAMHGLVTPEHLEAVRHFKQLFSRYRRNRDLISVGAYAAGTDALLDEAIARFPAMELYLQQRMDQKVTLTQSLIDLGSVFGIGRQSA